MMNFRRIAAGAAFWRLTALGGCSQTDFAHVVSTNYSQYNMWWFSVSIYFVNISQNVRFMYFRQGRFSLALG